MAFNTSPGFVKAALRACMLLGVLSLAAAAAPEGWDDVEQLLDGSAEEFHSLVDPLINITALTYSTTNGSYYVKGSDAIKVPGFWQDKDLMVEHPNGGLRALVYPSEDEEGPVVVAFRGSDWGLRSRGSYADLCFDAAMISNQRPDFCKTMDDEELDYFGGAIEAVNNTMNSHPGRSIIATGHSAGCALAAMMAVDFYPQKVTAVCFGLPGVLPYTSVKTGKTLEEVASIGSKSVYSIGFAEDPVVVSGLQINVTYGKVYLWNTQTTPACAKCCVDLKKSNVSQVYAGGTCQECFGVVHQFGAYLGYNYYGREDKAKILEAIPECSLWEDYRPRKKLKKEHALRGIGGRAIVLLPVCVAIVVLMGVGMAVMAYLKDSKNKIKGGKYLELEEPNPVI